MAPISSSMIMKEEIKKEPYEAPKAVLVSVRRGQCVLVTFSLQSGFGEVEEDDDAW